MSRILVTGGAGLIGSHVAEFYARQGDDVTILDNLLRSTLFKSKKPSVEHNVKYLTSNYKNIKFIKGDVRDEKDIRKAIGERADLIVHTAAQPGVPSSMKMPKDDFFINGFGTVNVLETARQICPECTFVYCSTNKIYGENVDKIPLIEKETRYSYDGVEGVSEEMSVDQTGHTCYGASKLAGDLYTQEYAENFGMKTGVFRMSCIYGTRQFGFEEQGWATWFVIQNLLKKPITIFGDGKQVRDMLYVEDVVRAYDTFHKSGMKKAVFNLGGGKNNTVSLLEFIKFLEGKTGNKMDVTFADWRPSDQKVYISDISKIQRELGWKPAVGCEQGIERVLKWVGKNQDLFK